MTHEELKECIGEYRELKKNLWWANCWGVQKVDGYNFGVHYNDFAGHWQFSWNDPENEHRVADVEDIFDSQEDCEEYWEFGNVTRTEKLELPTWEEVNKSSLYTLYFNNPELYLYRVYFNRDTKTISIEEQNEEYLECFTEIENLKFTKENFNKARRLCVKLFKGESV